MDPQLHRAAELGNWDVIKQFENQLDFQRTPNKDTVLHVLSLFRDSSFAVEKILESNPKLLLELNAQGETALHIAARKGHSNVVRAVIDCIKCKGGCRSVLCYLNVHGNLALHEAVKNNRCEIVQLLVEDPDLTDIAKQEKESLLYLAVEKGDEGLVNLILSACKPFRPPSVVVEAPTSSSPSFGPPSVVIDAPTSSLSEVAGFRGLDGRTALHAAAIRNFTECLEPILHEFPHLTEEVDSRGWTALHYAARFNHQEVARKLLRANRSMGYVKAVKKFEPSNEDEDGNETALHVAITCGHIQVIEELLTHCPDCWSMVTRMGKNAIHLAVENEQQEVLNIMLRKPWVSELVNSMDADGNTPLHLYAATKELLGHELANHPGVERNALNKAGLTPLDLTRNAADQNKERQDFLRSGFERAGAIQGNGNIPLTSKDSMAPPGPRIEKLNRIAETYQVVATLIITISFAAGFTIPGGYESTDGPRNGQPVFLKKSAFIAFITCDVIAMMYSLVALILLLVLSDTIRPKKLQETLNLCGIYIISALVALLGSFVAGLYVAVPNLGFRMFLFVFVCIPGSALLLLLFKFYIMYFFHLKKKKVL